MKNRFNIRLRRTLCVVLTLLLVLFCGCNASYSGTKAEANCAPGASSPSADTSYNESLKDGYSGGSTVTSGSSAALREEKIIRNAAMTLETYELDGMLATLTELTGQLGGYVMSSSVSGSLGSRRAYYTLGIPAEKLDEFLGQSGTLGNVTAQSTESQNITDDYYDAEARLTNLKAQETRLRELLGKAEHISEIMEIEARISEVRYEIEALEGQLRAWQTRVSYSTVTLTIREVGNYTLTDPTFGDEVGNAFGQGIAAVVGFLRQTVLFVAGNVIWLLLLAAAAVLTVHTVRRRGKKRADPQPSTPPDAPDKDN